MNTNNNSISSKNLRKLKLRYDAMLKRCYDPSVKIYKWYGQKGVTVCKTWKKSFASFACWAIDNGFDPSLQLDRIDNRKGYIASNCRWITQAENLGNRAPLIPNKHGEYAFNRKNNLPYHIIRYKNNVHKKNPYKVEFSVNCIQYVIGHYETLEQALKARNQAYIDYREGKLKGVLKQNCKSVMKGLVK